MALKIICIIPKSPWTCLKFVVSRIEDVPFDVPASHFLIIEDHVPGVELVEVPTGHILRIERISVTTAEYQSVYICKKKNTSKLWIYLWFAHIAKKTMYCNFNLHY